MKIVAIAVMVFFATAPVFAVETNRIYRGSDLLRDCQTVKEFGHREFLLGCERYVVGVLDSYQVATVLLKPSIKAFCLPKGGTTDQMIKVVIKYLENHPEQLHLPAANVIYLALDDAFPCK